MLVKAGLLAPITDISTFQRSSQSNGVDMERGHFRAQLDGYRIIVGVPRDWVHIGSVLRGVKLQQSKG